MPLGFRHPISQAPGPETFFGNTEQTANFTSRNAKKPAPLRFVFPPATAPSSKPVGAQEHGIRPSGEVGRNAGNTSWSPGGTLPYMAARVPRGRSSAEHSPLRLQAEVPNQNRYRSRFPGSRRCGPDELPLSSGPVLCTARGGPRSARLPASWAAHPAPSPSFQAESASGQSPSRPETVPSVGSRSPESASPTASSPWVRGWAEHR